jgi:riboflavin synthase
VFTGIIEHSGTIEALTIHADGGRVCILAPEVAPALAVSKSIAVNGCCLTVVSVDGERFCADLSGGHFVLGHVDGVGRVAHLRAEGENWWYGVEVPADFARYIVPKGSITLDGVSLTVARWQAPLVEIAVIPFTYEHTNLRYRQAGDAVNLEGDVLGKYVERHLEARANSAAASGSLSLAHLIEEGF